MASLLLSSFIRCQQFSIKIISRCSRRDSNSIYTIKWRQNEPPIHKLFPKILTSVTRLGDLLHFGQLLKACGNNYFAQIAQIFRNFCKVVKICRFSSEIIFVQLFTGHTGGHYDIITNLFPPKRFTIISTFHSPRDLSCRESNVKCFFKKIKHFFSDLYTMKTSSRIV